MPDILISKADGKSEPFDVLKLEQSLRKARASDKLIEKVVKHVMSRLVTGMTTQEIYTQAFSFLHSLEKPIAIRYSLKRAIMDLGPSGFPFEQLIARLFTKAGYTVETDKMIVGKCAEHEVDIIAYNERKLVMIEAKFHNSIGNHSDLKVALYIKARLDDLRAVSHQYGKKRNLDEGWLITNTKFTTSAIKYAECQNITLIGWNFPLHHSLQDMIEAAELHPVTCLTSLTANQKRSLITNNNIVCADILADKNLLKEIGLSTAEIESVDREIDLLYQK